HLLNETVPAVEAVADLRTAVTEQEIGAQGYALTADDTFRETFDAGVTETAAALTRIGALLGGAPGVTGELDDIRGRLDDWQRRVAEPSFDERAEVRELVATPEFQQTALRHIQAVRAEIDQLADRVDDEMTTGAQALRDATATVTRVVIVQVAGVVLLGALIVAALSRQVVTPL